MSSTGSGTKPAQELVHVEHVMGTAVSFRIRLQPGDPTGGAEQALERACDELHGADEIFSTWKPESPLNRIRGGFLSLDDAPAVIEEVLDLSGHVRTLSSGWFDPWSMPGGVDPTGLVKGWAVERALGALRVPEVVAACVNAGGDVAVFGRPDGAPRWRIGIRHPWRPEALACIVLVDDAVATSGTYERGSHLVDPRTGERRASAASATVVGPSLAVADGLATALAVGGDEVLTLLGAITGYEGYLVRTDGSEGWTEGMPFAS
jgi:thiamine biosynthesis lipoprotein